MAAESPARRIQRARRRRYNPFVSGHSVETATELLEKARQRDARRFPGITYWRQSLTLAAAHRRALAGDRTAERRLAWGAAIRTWRQHGTWLQSRFRAIDREIARMRGDGAPCAGCARGLERLSENRDVYLEEIAKLPAMAVPYAAYVRGVRPTASPGLGAHTTEDGDTITPEQTLAAAGISDQRQSEYQRKMSTLLGDGGAR